jgi:release factor glutamine methyltransferase
MKLMPIMDLRLKFKPLAYILKKNNFLGLNFYLDERVYVPNLETELMVKYAIKYIQTNNLEEGIIADIGTGCANIAITLAKKFPKAKIIAIDISIDALEVAKINLKAHHIKNIELLNTDMITDLTVKPDLLIANLPWGDDNHLLQTNTKEALSFMPEIAIFAPDGIIGSYVRLFEQTKLKAWSNTVAIVEVGLLSEKMVRENLNQIHQWQYIKLPSKVFNYAVLKVAF